MMVSQSSKNICSLCYVFTYLILTCLSRVRKRWNKCPWRHKQTSKKGGKRTKNQRQRSSQFKGFFIDNCSRKDWRPWWYYTCNSWRRAVELDVKKQDIGQSDGKHKKGLPVKQASHWNVWGNDCLCITCQ